MRAAGSAVLSLVLGLSVLGAVQVPAQAAGRCGDHPWCDTSLSPDRRADLLLAELTLDEKVGLLGGDSLRDTGKPSDQTHTGIQDGVPRLDVPTINYSDGPVGPRQGRSIGLPAPIALAAGFDPALAARFGTVAASEAKLKGNDVVYAPTVDIVRTPRAGRTFETFGEDTYLTTRLGVSWIQGAQSTGVIANVKHFVGNNQEGEEPTGGELSSLSPLGIPFRGARYLQDAIIDERTLRETYLPQFEAAVKEAKVGTVMCAYNRVNSEFACQNRTLLEDVLRKDWGFQGYTIGDYLALHSTAGGLNNGLDFEPWPPIGYQPALIRTALALGRVSERTIDLHVHRMLRTWFAYGVFDRAAFRDDDSRIDRVADGAVAQRVAEQGATLLRNQGGVLPLSSSVRSIAVIGRSSTEFIAGGGSGSVEAFEVHSILDGIRQRAGSGVKVTYDDGSDPARAAAVARAADVAVVVVRDQYGEGADRGCLSLQCPRRHGDQDALVEAVAAGQPRTVALVQSGGVSLLPWRDKVAAVLQVWYPGAYGGPAVARVLFGDVDPGGRLPVTIPDAESQLPTAVSPARYPGAGPLGLRTQYDEGIFVGYRWYDRQGLRPAYPFGFGLSYTTFRMSGLSVERRDTGATVSATVTNTGSRTGYAVPQLYLGLPSQRGVEQPRSALKGFRKVQLAPGASTRVTFSLDERALSYWDATSDRWRVGPGCASVTVGSSSRSAELRGTLPVGGGRC
ncbi:MAG: glycoside hydrolase family 3 C-terminal domain-containing protein [Aeromicrobium erythreum]